VREASAMCAGRSATEPKHSSVALRLISALDEADINWWIDED
jgi:hypothetical protein